MGTLRDFSNQVVVDGMLIDEQIMEFSNQMRRTVVTLSFKDECRGCGVFLRGGYILTSAENDLDDVEFEVCYSDGQRYNGQVVDVDVGRAYGLAVFQIHLDQPSKNDPFDFAAFTSNRSLPVGIEVHFINQNWSHVVGELSCSNRRMNDIAVKLLHDDIDHEKDNLDEHEKLALCSSDPGPISWYVSLIEVNNIHEDSFSFGAPLFDVQGKIIGLYGFIINGNLYGIHVSSIVKYIHELRRGGKISRY